MQAAQACTSMLKLKEGAVHGREWTPTAPEGHELRVVAISLWQGSSWWRLLPARSGSVPVPVLIDS